MYEHGGVNPKEIRAKRLSLWLTQRQLAEKIGVTKETIGTWERGINKPSFEHYDKLYSFFDEHKTEIEKEKAPQLMLFNVSLYAKSVERAVALPRLKANHRIVKKRTQKPALERSEGSVKKEAESLQFQLW